jgi:hypothetical protein
VAETPAKFEGHVLGTGLNAASTSGRDGACHGSHCHVALLAWLRQHANADSRCGLIRWTKVAGTNLEESQTLKNALDGGSTAAQVLADRDRGGQARRKWLPSSKLMDRIARRAELGQEWRQCLQWRA